MTNITEHTLGAEVGQLIARSYRRDQPYAQDRTAHDFAHYLRSTRVALGWSRSRLAELSGLRSAQILALELAVLPRETISSTEVMALARALDKDPRFFAILLEREFLEIGAVTPLEHWKDNWRAVSAFFGSWAAALKPLGLATAIFVVALLSAFSPQLSKIPGGLFDNANIENLPWLTILLVSIQRFSRVLMTQTPMTLAIILGLMFGWYAVRKRDLPLALQYLVRQQTKRIVNLSLALLFVTFALAGAVGYQSTPPLPGLQGSARPVETLRLSMFGPVANADVRIYEVLTGMNGPTVLWIQPTIEQSSRAIAGSLIDRGDAHISVCRDNCRPGVIFLSDGQPTSYTATIRIYHLMPDRSTNTSPGVLTYMGNVIIRTNTDNDLVDTLLKSPGGVALWCLETDSGGVQMESGCAMSPLGPSAVIKGTIPTAQSMVTSLERILLAWINQNAAIESIGQVTQKPLSAFFQREASSDFGTVIRPTSPWTTPVPSVVRRVWDWVTTSVPSESNTIPFSETPPTPLASLSAKPVSDRAMHTSDLNSQQPLALMQLICLALLYGLMWTEIRREGLLRHIYAAPAKPH